jgi:hypothetical protein
MLVHVTLDRHIVVSLTRLDLLDDVAREAAEVVASADTEGWRLLAASFLSD